MTTLYCFFRYHNLDDEPSCRLFEFDLESIPLERAILKEHIRKEIQGYHIKRPKPILTPVITSFGHNDGGAGGVRILEETSRSKTVLLENEGKSNKIMIQF